MKASYHGYLLEPPFEPRREHEMWTGLEPREQTREAAVKDLMYELDLAAEEGEPLPGPVPVVATIEAFKAALDVAALDLEDDGSDCVHWFLLRW